MIAAGALHLAVILLVPLPDATVAPSAEPETGIEITFPDLAPPPMPEPRELPFIDTTRLVPVPFKVEPALEPVTEPAPVADALLPFEATLLAIGEPVAPPDDGRIYEEGDPHLTLPVPLPGRVAPVYPQVAAQSRMTGRVVLRAVVTAEGNVDRIEVIQAPRPDVGFSRAAIAAVSTWTYRPGLRHGRPVAVALTVEVEFTLN